MTDINTLKHEKQTKKETINADEKTTKKGKKTKEPKVEIIEKKKTAEKISEKTVYSAARVRKQSAQVEKIHVEKKAKKTVKKKLKVVLARGKRKEAIARAVISTGAGRFVFNNTLFNTIPNKYIKEMIQEPLGFVGAELNKIDIKVYVRGGGQMGQAQAARTAVAKALVEYTQDEQLKNAYLGHDRSILIEDVRRVEPKKYKGPKARARFQKSYR
ncbi:MAG: 30S ribosomal protein S9 [Candidatus Micrarchaeota archaeon]